MTIPFYDPTRGSVEMVSVPDPPPAVYSVWRPRRMMVARFADINPTATTEDIEDYRLEGDCVSGLLRYVRILPHGQSSPRST